MSYDPARPHTWPEDLVGARPGTDELVYRCSCGCGGHVLIRRVAAVALDVARDEARARAATGRQAHCFGSSFYIEGHAPMGIVGAGPRTGRRTQLRAST